MVLRFFFFCLKGILWVENIWKEIFQKGILNYEGEERENSRTVFLNLCETAAL